MGGYAVKLLSKAQTLTRIKGQEYPRNADWLWLHDKKAESAVVHTESPELPTLPPIQSAPKRSISTVRLSFVAPVHRLPPTNAQQRRDDLDTLLKEFYNRPRPALNLHFDGDPCTQCGYKFCTQTEHWLR